MLVVLTQGYEDEKAADQIIAEISRVVWERRRIHPPATPPSPPSRCGKGLVSDVGRRSPEAHAELALEFLDTLPHRRVGPAVTVDELRAALGGPLPEHGEEPRGGDRAARPGGRSRAGRHGRAALLRLRHRRPLPAALAADWLTSAWDQNATLYVSVARELGGRGGGGRLAAGDPRTCRARRASGSRPAA